MTHRHPTWTNDKLILETNHPFTHMEIQDNTFLDKLEVNKLRLGNNIRGLILRSRFLKRYVMCMYFKERQPCDICFKSRKFFCYTCHVPLPSIRNLIPRVVLPIQVNAMLIP